MASVCMLKKCFGAAGLSFILSSTYLPSLSVCPIHLLNHYGHPKGFSQDIVVEM